MNLEISHIWSPQQPGIRTASHRETYADFKLSVLGKVLTRNQPLQADAEMEDARDTVPVSLFPLAEFIAANWWPLLHEPVKRAISPQAFSGRHQIIRHTDGFAYPDVAFYGADSRIKIKAFKRQIPSADLQFVNELQPRDIDTLHRGEIEDALLSFLDDVRVRLSDSDDRKWLSETLQAILRSRSDAEEREYCELAGMLGADPYATGDQVEQAISQAREILGPDLARESFATSEVETVIDQARGIHQTANDAIQRSKKVAHHVEKLRNELLKRENPIVSKPWERGYNAALAVREILEVGAMRPAPADSRALNKLLLGSMAASIDTLPSSGPISARGLGVSDERGFGLALDASQKPTKFQLLSTYADYLLADDASIFLSTSASTDRQKSNRAFAAEFLAPSKAIEEQLAGRAVTAAEITKLAFWFGVPNMLIEYQIENHGIGASA